MRMTSQAQHSGHASQPVHPLALANALAFMPFGVGGSFFAGRLRDIGALWDCEPEAVAEDLAPFPVSDGTLEQPHRACRDDGIARHARHRGQPGRIAASNADDQEARHWRQRRRDRAAVMEAAWPRPRMVVIAFSRRDSRDRLAQAPMARRKSSIFADAACCAASSCCPRAASAALGRDSCAITPSAAPKIAPITAPSRK